MNSARLDALARDGVAFDLETHLIQPGLVAPPVVCGSVASIGTHSEEDHTCGCTRHCIQGAVGDRVDAFKWFEAVLLDSRYTLVGANIAFDVICVMSAMRDEEFNARVFEMYDSTCGAVRGDVDGRVYDVQIAEALHAIARGHLGYDPFTYAKMRGRYSLDECTKQVLGREDAKSNDRFRLSYALLEGTPIEQWPPEARTYPVDDAANTLECALAQAGHLPSVRPHAYEKINRYPWIACRNCGGAWSKSECRSAQRVLNAHEISRQTYASLCLNLGAAWGYRVNQKSVDALEAKYDAEHSGALGPFLEAGIIRADGTENQGVLKRLVAEAFGTEGACADCAGTRDHRGAPAPGKVVSETTGTTLVNCRSCDGTGLALSPAVPRTEAGRVAISRDALNESGSELLISYAGHGEAKKIKTVYIPYLRSAERDGTTHTDVPRLLRPNALVETGRVSYDGATMLLPRHGGVRECIEARPGWLLSGVDYKAGELVTHAQSCFWIVGHSKLAEALNEGLDAHLALACTILRIPYEEGVRRKKDGDKLIAETRQVSKPPNFGFPGRMGPFKLVVQQRRQNDVHTPHPSGPQWILDSKGNRVRGYKGLRFCLFMGRAERCGEVLIDEWKGRKYDSRVCRSCVECAAELRVSWGEQWPENEPYFAHVMKVDESGEPMVQHVSKRLRGFRQGQVDEDGEPINSGNAIANGYFQSLLADAAKNAYMAATRECYDRRVRVRSHTKYTSRFDGGPSPLYGSRLPQFQHDEIIGEHPEDVASDAVIRVSEIMCEALRLACPDLERAVEAEPTLTRKLYKGAEPVYVDGRGERTKALVPGGRVLPWEPK